MFALSRIIARDSKTDLDDTANTKFALTALRYHDDTETGLSPYADNDLFDSIKKFQKDHNLTIDGVMKPLGETVTKINNKLKEDTSFLGAFQDFRKNFNLINEASTKGGDKYFHCKANYEATKRGWSGKYAAEVMSDIERNKRYFLYRTSWERQQKDQHANLYDRKAAESGKFSSGRDACEIFRPKNLDEKY